MVFRTTSIFLLTVLAMLGSLQAQNLNIPDSRFKNFLVNEATIGDMLNTPLDQNDDGEIQVAEAEQCLSLELGLGKSKVFFQGPWDDTPESKLEWCMTDLTGLEHFINLQSLHIFGAWCINDFDFTALESLETFKMSNYRVRDYNEVDYILPAPNLDFTGLKNLKSVDVNDMLVSINLEGCEHLEVLDIPSGDLTNLDVSDHPKLRELNIGWNNSLSNFISGSLPELETLYCAKTPILIDLLNFPKLKFLSAGENIFEQLDFSNTPLIEHLTLSNSQRLTQIELRDLLHLTYLSLNNSELLVDIDLHNLPELKDLYMDDLSLETFDISQFPLLESLSLRRNGIKDVSIVDAENLEDLYLSGNLLSSIVLEDLPKLYRMYLDGNLLTNMELSNLPELNTLYLDNNELISIKLEAFPKLKYLSVQENKLISQELNDLPLLYSVNFSSNQFRDMNLSDFPELDLLYMDDNVLVDLDVSNLFLTRLEVENNQLEYLNIKNDNAIRILILNGNPDGMYICSDDDESDIVDSACQSAGLINCIITTDCSYTPDSEVTLIGAVRYDEDGNGCTDSDLRIPFVRHDLVSPNGRGFFVADDEGAYDVSIPSGAYTVTPQLEYENYFDVDPVEYNIDQNTLGTLIRDVCVTPKAEVFNDLEILVFSIDRFSPGFNVGYKVEFKNKGNRAVSGMVDFRYDVTFMEYARDPQLDLSEPVAGNLVYDFDNLNPLESRSFEVHFDLNAPLDLVPLIGGETLCVEVEISSTLDEQTPEDNIFQFCNTIVNSWDPNDKTCLEGNLITPDMIGEYVHYMIRFENTGTASAVNILVKDTIDTEVFDINTFQVVSSSHKVETQLSEGSIVDFIFDNIELPYLDAENDGYIVFKIKTKDDLVLGDQISNSAAIYFDFNPPIITNNETSTFGYADLDNDGFTSDEDCDDDNSDINPGRNEDPYNGIDDDCNPLTLDDDLDQDGYLFADDCDDNNPSINPGQSEVIYNGLDEDCNPLTLDDDLDQDGYGIEEDCDDDNSDINPDAEEIANNGIDEDCDGADLTSALHELTNGSINIYPNPAVDIINISVDAQIEYTASLFGLQGNLFRSVENAFQIDVETISPGTYILLIEDLSSGQRVMERIVIGR